jgi:RNA polymerase-binding transcription factor DksA
MSANSSVRVVENPIERHHGSVWNKLHAEREEVCEALLKEGIASHEPSEDQQMSGQRQNETWHKDLLQARLRKIDDALDRLMTGSYGNCCKCGRWIQDSKLEFDPAVAFCVECWERTQTQH